jgi:hypothetical protein
MNDTETRRFVNASGKVHVVGSSFIRFAVN